MSTSVMANTEKAQPSGKPTVLPIGLLVERLTRNILSCTDTKFDQAPKISLGNWRIVNRCHNGMRGIPLNVYHQPLDRVIGKQCVFYYLCHFEPNLLCLSSWNSSNYTTRKVRGQTIHCLLCPGRGPNSIW